MLARHNEYQADAISVELTSAEVAGNALTSVHVFGPYVDEYFWRPYYGQAQHYEVPEILPYSGLNGFIRDAKPSDALIENNLSHAMSIETSYDNTHPSLRDRLSALQVTSPYPVLPEVSSAEFWFAEKYSQVIDDFNQHWWENNKEQWSERFHYAREGRLRLADYAEKSPELLADDELWDFASLSFNLCAVEEALPLYHLYQQRYPDNDDVSFMLGKTLYHMGDEGCIDWLDKVKDSYHFGMEACELAFYFLSGKQRDEEAAYWHNQANILNKKIALAEYERNAVVEHDLFTAPSLDGEIVEDLVKQIKQYDKIDEVWIGQKVVDHFQDMPVFIVAFTTKGFLMPKSAKLQQVLAESIKFPYLFYVAMYKSNNKRLVKRVMAEGRQII